MNLTSGARPLLLLYCRDATVRAHVVIALIPGPAKRMLSTLPGVDVDPLSPDNILCFMNGPLSGGETSMSGGWAAVTKSPLTNTVTDSHQGGWSAARVRWAGFDGLVFEGKADALAKAAAAAASGLPTDAGITDGMPFRTYSSVWLPYVALPFFAFLAFGLKRFCAECYLPRIRWLLLCLLRRLNLLLLSSLVCCDEWHNCFTR